MLATGCCSYTVWMPFDRRGVKTTCCGTWLQPDAFMMTSSGVMDGSTPSYKIMASMMIYRRVFPYR